LILVALAVLSDSISKKPLAEANLAAMASNQYVSSNLRNAEAIEAMGMLPNLMRRWYRFQATLLERQSYASDRAAAVNAITKAVTLTLQSGILGLGGLLVIEGEASPGIINSDGPSLSTRAAIDWHLEGLCDCKNSL
jgi:ATP-binding cassette subfamily C exporter for protease/lipase